MKLSFGREVLRFSRFLCYGLFGFGGDGATALPKMRGSRPSAVAGCMLQWIAIGVLAIELARWSDMPQVGFTVSLFGIMSFIAGLILAIRAGALGPIIIVPGLIGLAVLLVVTAILYPLRLFLPNR